jgi:putative peptidoglycan lipid II flippase
MPSESASPCDVSPPPQPQGRRLASGFRIVSLLTIASRILGMARDMAMAWAFGAGPLMDAFTLAFRIPNLARRLFGEGALTTAFLPVFVRELELRGAEQARRVATAVMLTLGAILLGVVVLGELFLGAAWLLTPPGSEGRMLILLTAQMLPYLLLICLAAQAAAVLQSVERFFWPSVLPILLNVVWIAATLLAVRLLEDPQSQIQGVAMSVVLAGLLQCLVGWWAMHAGGFHFARRWREALPQVREIAAAMVPVLFGLSIQQFNNILDNVLAWGLARSPQTTGPMLTLGSGRAIDWPLESGTASALFYAQRMFQFPVGVIGIALGTVLFPLLARHAERGELQQVGRDQTLSLKLAAAVGLPASVGLMLLARPIAVLLFQRGAFTPEDAELTGQCILAYGGGVWATLGLIMIHRGFYALGDRATPIRVGLYAVGINMLLNMLLIWPLAGSGLAWATTLAAIAQVGIALVVYQRAFGLLDLADARRTLLRALLPTVLMAAACWLTMQWLPPGASTLSRLLAVIGPFAASVVVYLGAARMIGLSEPFLLLSRGEPR